MLYFIQTLCMWAHRHAFHVASSSPFLVASIQLSDMEGCHSALPPAGGQAALGGLFLQHVASRRALRHQRQRAQSPAAQVNPGQVTEGPQERAGRISTDGLCTAVHNLYRFRVENAFCSPFLPFIVYAKPGEENRDPFRLFHLWSSPKEMRIC